MTDTAGGFEFKISAEGPADSRVIRVSGDVDLANTPELAAHLKRVPNRVTIDLGDVTYFGSTAAAVLVAAASDGAEVTLRRVPSNVRRVLDIMAIADMFSYEDDDAANGGD